MSFSSNAAAARAGQFIWGISNGIETSSPEAVSEVSLNPSETIFKLLKNQEMSTEALLSSLQEAIDAGADINARSSDQTPLMLLLTSQYASRHDLVDVLEFLISRGADVNADDSEIYRDNLCRQSVLHNAMRSLPYMQQPVVVLSILLNAGVNVHLRDGFGETALSIMFSPNNSDSLSFHIEHHGSFVDIVRLLIDAGASVLTDARSGVRRSDGRDQTIMLDMQSRFHRGPMPEGLEELITQSIQLEERQRINDAMLAVLLGTRPGAGTNSSVLRADCSSIREPHIWEIVRECLDPVSAEEAEARAAAEEAEARAAANQGSWMGYTDRLNQVRAEAKEELLRAEAKAEQAEDKAVREGTEPARAEARVARAEVERAEARVARAEAELARAEAELARAEARAAAD